MREYLRKLRENQGLTQKQVANAIGISQCYYCQIEKGWRGCHIGIDTFYKLANVLGADFNEFCKSEIKWMEANT